MAGLGDEQPGQGAPSAANGIKRTPLAAVGPVDLGQMAFDDGGGAVAVAARSLGQAQDAQRHGGIGPGEMAAIQGHQFQAAAAQIGDDAIGLGRAAQNAHGGKAGFFLARQHGDRGLTAFFDLTDELFAIDGVADGGGGQDVQHGHRHGPSQTDEASQAGQGLAAALGVQAPRSAQALAQSADGLLVEDGHRRAGQAVIDHQPDRVGPDVDDGHMTVGNVGLEGRGRVHVGQG